MASIIQSSFTGNSPIHQHQRRKILVADIKVSSFKDTFSYTIIIRRKGQILWPHFHILQPDESTSSERAWLLAYQKAWSWADENVPDARLYIAEVREERGRTKAA